MEINFSKRFFAHFVVRNTKIFLLGTNFYKEPFVSIFDLISFFRMFLWWLTCVKNLVSCSKGSCWPLLPTSTVDNGNRFDYTEAGLNARYCVSVRILLCFKNNCRAHYCSLCCEITCNSL